MGTGTTKLLVLVILVGILAVAARRYRNAEALPAAAEGETSSAMDSRLGAAARASTVRGEPAEDLS